MGKKMLAWNRWYSVKSYVASALWIVPLFALIAAFVVKRASEWFGSWAASRGWWLRGHAFLDLDPAAAQSLLDRLFSLNVSFLVFTFGSLLVAIQVAGGQYTPRIIATTLLRDNVIRFVSGIFVFSLLWANRTMVQIGASPEHVPQFQVFLSAGFGLLSLIAFLLLIDYAARLLRPISLVARIGEKGIDVIENVYPTVTQNAQPATRPAARQWRLLPWSPAKVNTQVNSAHKLGAPARTVYHQGDSGIVLAVNVHALIAEAVGADCVLEVAPQVGDFIAVDEPLFYIYGNAGAVDDRRLRSLIAFGTERTIEQDPLFAFRILVDIALKALSPAINDPTTATLAIDQLHRLLRMVGMRSLRTDEFADAGGQLRLIFRTPNWENFVHLAFREIRMCGAGSLQVVRRLHAMIDNLKQTLPGQRHAALQIELDLLNRAAARHFNFSEDLTLARVPDSQGMGGSTRAA